MKIDIIPKKREGERDDAYKKRVENSISIKQLSPSQLQSWKKESKLSFDLPGDKEKFEDYLKAFPNARLQHEHCDSAQEVNEAIKILTAIGALKGSRLHNLIESIMEEDEAKVLDRNREDALPGITPPSPSQPPRPR